MCEYCPASNLNTEEFPSLFFGFFLSCAIKKSPGWLKNASNFPTMTTSKSRKSVVPERPPKSFLKTVSFLQPRSGDPAGSSSSGSSCISTSGRMPMLFSVKQTNLNLASILRDTIAYRRFTYSGENLLPHFMQIIFIGWLKLRAIHCNKSFYQYSLRQQ